MTDPKRALALGSFRARCQLFVVMSDAFGPAPRSSRGQDTSYWKPATDPLDLLGTIEDDTTYGDVVDESYRVDLGGFEVRALSLERLLVAKQKLGRPKDKLMVLQIEATLDERRKKSDP